MQAAALWYSRVFVGLGLIYAALSELLFYPVDMGAFLVELLVWYGLAAIFGVALIARRGGGGVLGFYVSALVLGFVVEGVPVPALYEALPFTIVWTSMAWHGIVSGLVGVYLLRLALLRSTRAGLLACGLFGLLLGAWAAYFWGAEPGGVGYLLQGALGCAVFIAGQVVLPHGTPPKRGMRVVLWGSGALLAFGYAVQALNVLSPSVLILPIALWFCWGAGRAGSGALWPDLDWRRVWVFAALPLTAYPSFLLGADAVWVQEMNVWVILTFGPASLLLFGVALWRSWRMRGF